MLQSYLATAVRQLLAQKLYTAINVVGLALGLACALLIALFVRHELSYDGQFANSERIVRISEFIHGVDGNPERHYAGAAAALAPLLKDFFPEIERSARLLRCPGVLGRTVLAVGDETYVESSFAGADNELFEIFDFDWLQGDPRTALIGPRAIVLTESTAQRYFGRTDVVGRTLAVFQPPVTLEVTGVIADLPDNTHLQLDLLTSLSGLSAEVLTSWGGFCFHTYALLSDKASAEHVQSRSADFYERRFREGSSRFRGFAVVPIEDIHLRSAREGELRTPGSLRVVYTFGAVALFIVLIACLNFVNLWTARAAQRAKEVGVRKASGASQGQLVGQFLFESLLLTVAAFAIGATLAAALLTPFASFVEREIGFSELGGWAAVGTLVGATLLLGIGAGTYPAFFLSAFKPIRVLRGDVTRGRSGALLRRILVVLQFSISVALIIAALVVIRQERFARQFELGYEKDQIVVLTGSPNQGLGMQWRSLKQQLLELPGVSGATASVVTPGTRSGVGVLAKPAGADGYGVLMPLMLVDYGFFETYGIDVIAGQSFDEARGDREITPQPGTPELPSPFILSRLAAERLGWTPEQAIGRPIDVAGPGVVIGVVEDAYLESVRDALAPVAYLVPAVERFSVFREASIRMSGANLDATLAAIDEIWRELGPGTPVVRRFLDDDFEAMYRSERRQAQLLTVFAALAVFIACLGLLGLASATTLRRTKEIGIRKTLGASVGDVVRQFVTEFGALVLVANLIAWPIAYIAMRRWLSGFAYRIELGPLVFIASGLMALAVATLTVAAVASRAARAKPVTALRYE